MPFSTKSAESRLPHRGTNLTELAGQITVGFILLALTCLLSLGIKSPLPQASFASEKWSEIKNGLLDFLSKEATISALHLTGITARLDPPRRDNLVSILRTEARQIEAELEPLLGVATGYQTRQTGRRV